MATDLSTKTKRDMAMNGWGMETFGLDADGHEIPMYLHRDSLNDKVFGDKFSVIRVDDPRNFPKNLLGHEVDLFNRKWRQIGITFWKPGEDCLAREFKSYADVVNDRGETVPRWGEPQMGCKPCRDRDKANQSGLTAGTAEASVASNDVANVSTEPVQTNADVVQPETITCDLCDKYTATLVRSNGSLSTIKQQRFGLKVHKRKKHKKSRTAEAVPA